MRGYGGILVAGILFTSLVPTLLSIIFLVEQTNQVFNTLYREEIMLSKERLISSIDIVSDNVTWINSTLLSVPVKNTGSVHWLAREFRHIDVILKYVSNNRNLTVFIVYNQSQSPGTGFFWKVNRVYLENLGYEVENPVGVSDSSVYGLWDPDEIMEIYIYLPIDLPRDASTTYMVKIVTPDGVGDSMAGV
jgi:hypothetical protein